MSKTIEMSESVEITLLDVDQIQPNSWNPNMMQDEKFRILKSKIRESGVVVQPILVFKEEDSDHYTVADGEHRFLAAKEAGLSQIPVVVVPMSETEAKIETIAMNALRGNYIPLKMAELLVDLKDTYSEAQIRALTGMDDDEVQSLTSLLDVGEFNFDSAPVISVGHKETPIPVHLVLFPQQYKMYQDSMEMAVEMGGGMVTPLFGDQVIEYDKAMKTAFNISGVYLRNKGLAAVCAVFNELSEEERNQLLEQVLEKRPTLLDD